MSTCMYVLMRVCTAAHPSSGSLSYFWTSVFSTIFIFLPSPIYTLSFGNSCLSKTTTTTRIRPSHLEPPVVAFPFLSHLLLFYLVPSLSSYKKRRTTTSFHTHSFEQLYLPFLSFSFSPSLDSCFCKQRNDLFINSS